MNNKEGRLDQAGQHLGEIPLSSARLNYGVQENTENRLKNLNISSLESGGKGFNLDGSSLGSLRNLPLPNEGQANGNQSNKLTGNSVLGMSQNPILSDISSGSPSPGLSLKSLASNHLNELPGSEGGSSGLSLGSLASDYLSGNQRSLGLGTSSESSGIGLSSLASNHLSGSSKLSGLAPSGPSLGSLASNHLIGSSKSSGLTTSLSSGLSLSSLASNHLNGSSKPSGLSSSLSSGLSLSSLASNHLVTEGAVPTLCPVATSSSASLEKSSPSSTQFTIPAIFGPKTLPSPSTDTNAGEGHKDRSASPELEIDLMSALKLGNTGQENLMDTNEEVKEIIKVELTVPDLSRIRSELRKRKRSGFSKVITRKWLRTDPRSPVRICLPTNNIPLFQFCEPSPDDIVMKAQSQSKAFNRPSPVRQPVRT